MEGLAVQSEKSEAELEGWVSPLSFSGRFASQRVSWSVSGITNFIEASFKQTVLPIWLMASRPEGRQNP